MKKIIACLWVLLIGSFTAVAGETEFIGKFDIGLVADMESFERLTFKFVSPDKNAQLGLSENAQVSAAALIDPATGAPAVKTVLIEERGKAPLMFVDLNSDKSISPDEKITLSLDPETHGIYEATIKIPFKDKTFTVLPIIVRYFKGYRTSKMAEGDRFIQQSTGIYARGTVDIKGRKVLAQYAYDMNGKSIDPTMGWLGLDSDGDGKIDMDSLSPEAMRVNGEAAIFRIGDTYVSTKKADLKKDSIILRENPAKDYKRIELVMGNTVPDFEFDDLKGKKHKFSEFRGKYVLLDIWGFWCPACRDELPYLREAFNRFKERNLEIVGVNTDEYPPSQIRKTAEENGMNWTHASFESTLDILRKKWMITSFPTTLLISPEGKIISRGRTDKGEPDLRGEDLLETLDKVLPQP
jgi:peroxiredoxin